SARYRTTPSAAARPNAEPPVSTTASTCATTRRGESTAISRVAGAPPRTSALPTVPSGNNSTVTPVPRPVQWPARTPATGSALTDSSRERADLACELDDERVELLGALEHEHVAAVAHELEAGAGNEPRHLFRVTRRREQIGGTAHDERGDLHVGQVAGEVEA